MAVVSDDVTMAVSAKRWFFVATLSEKVYWRGTLAGALCEGCSNADISTEADDGRTTVGGTERKTNSVPESDQEKPKTKEDHPFCVDVGTKGKRSH